MILKKNIVLLFLIFLISNQFLSASILEEIPGMNPSSVKQELPTPNPAALHPDWWSYFTVETEEELRSRIALTIQKLQEAYTTLPLENQATAKAVITKITSTLNALPYVSKKEEIPITIPQPFLKAYTVEKQIEIHQQLRKSRTDLQNEKERYAQAQDRLIKAQKNVDNMMVGYLAQSVSNAKKLLNGLEIISYRANIGLGERNLLQESRLIEEWQAKVKKFENELDFAKDHLDFRNFDQHQLETTIDLYEQELKKKQQELATAEVNLLGAFSDSNERSYQFVLEQQILQAAVNRSHTWAKLAFHTFKYNLLMLMNDRFQDNNDLRKNLITWREKLSEIHQQQKEWQKSAIKEQERVRQEYAALIAKSDSSDATALKHNNLQRQGVLGILTSLELLENEIKNTEWLVNLLDIHFRNTSSFIVNWWVSFQEAVYKWLSITVGILYFSLFKVNGVPITLMSIFKIIVIFGVSFWVSRFINHSLHKLSNRRKDIGQSLFYNLGGLTRYLLMLLGLIVSLWSIGLDFSSLLFIAGALMFGISLGFQSIANNFFCGLRILFERKLKIGDEIELESGHNGKVAEIHVQNTVVNTSDGKKVIVPNSELVSKTLVNWTNLTFDYRRLHIPFSVASGSDKELVREIVIEAAKRVPCALLHEDYHDPQVWMTGFDKRVLRFELVVWINYNAKSYTDSKDADFLWEIETSLRQHKIELALPFYIGDLLSEQGVGAHI